MSSIAIAFLRALKYFVTVLLIYLKGLPGKGLRLHQGGLPQANFGLGCLTRVDGELTAVVGYPLVTKVPLVFLGGLHGLGHGPYSLGLSNSQIGLVIRSG